MKPYHKIPTVWARDPETNYKTLVGGKWATPELDYLSDQRWIFTEKIDGTNIRVIFDGENVIFGGKTDDAQIPSHLINRLIEMFPTEKVKEVLNDTPGCLYGEGYGAKIQGGGKYIPDGCSFVLFDVMIGDLWLERENVKDISGKLNIGTAPIVGAGSLLEAIAYTKLGISSQIADCQAEGLVMRPEVELKDRRGNRIITKIKTKDFN